MDNRDILFASIVGSKVAKSIPRFDAVQNELQKHVMPPIPFLPLKNTTTIANGGAVEPFTNLWEADPPQKEEDQFFPLSFSIDQREWFLFPYEPMINISGKNNIIRRNVAKWNNDNNGKLSGTIKERWSQDDYTITITGVLMGSLLTGDVSDCYPISDFKRLADLLTTSKEIYVRCEPLQLLKINRIVVEDFSFPFTKGENVQAYEIKAYSDFSYNLLIEI